MAPPRRSRRSHPGWSNTNPVLACNVEQANAVDPTKPCSSPIVNTNSTPACGIRSTTSVRTASSITATAALLSAPTIDGAAFRITPSTTTGSSGAVGGTVSRWAQKKSGWPRMSSRGDDSRDCRRCSQPRRRPRLEARSGPGGQLHRYRLDACTLVAAWAWDGGQPTEQVNQSTRGWRLFALDVTAWSLHPVGKTFFFGHPDPLRGELQLTSAGQAGTLDTAMRRLRSCRP